MLSRATFKFAGGTNTKQPISIEDFVIRAAMLTSFGDSSSEPGGFNSTATSRSSSSTRLTLPAEISPTEGLTDVNTRRYVGVADMREIVNGLSKALQLGTTDMQFLAFERVTREDLAKIDASRTSIGRHMRMAYYADIDLLIVKLMPSVSHEAAHRYFSQDFDGRIQDMEVPRSELYPIGAGQIEGRNSSKEADSAYKPLPARSGKKDWPTIVFESGLSESLGRLRTDAKWWLIESGGQVKIAVLISIRPALSTLCIEKWELCLAEQPTTQAVSSNAQHPPQVPTCVQAINIDGNTVTGAPLTLEFEKIFLRSPTLPESDLVFTAQDLTAWANDFWAGVQ